VSAGSYPFDAQQLRQHEPVTRHRLVGIRGVRAGCVKARQPHVMQVHEAEGIFAVFAALKPSARRDTSGILQTRFRSPQVGRGQPRRRRGKLPSRPLKALAGSYVQPARSSLNVMRPTSPPRMGWRVLMGQLIMNNQIAILDQEQQSKTPRRRRFFELRKARLLR
jgi:hypothetical protein